MRISDWSSDVCSSDLNKEINSVDDFKGLKMRTPGLGGEVLTKMGGTVVNMPAGEIFTALQTGAIDATEWIGPYNDLALGLHKAAKYYRRKSTRLNSSH